jgi:hypothetical protein
MCKNSTFPLMAKPVSRPKDWLIDSCNLSKANFELCRLEKGCLGRCYAAIRLRYGSNPGKHPMWGGGGQARNPPPKGYKLKGQTEKDRVTLLFTKT